METFSSSQQLTFLLFILSQFILSSSSGSSIQTIKDKGGGGRSKAGEEVVESNRVEKTFSRIRRKIHEKDELISSSSSSSLSLSNQLDYTNGFSMYIPPSSSSSSLSSSSSSNAHSNNTPHSSLSSSRNHPKTVVYHLNVNGKSAHEKPVIRHSHGILGQSVTWTPTESPSQSTINVVSYSWRETGFTDCSLSCLGGIRENIINCIRDNDSMIVSQYLCNIEDKPDSITQTCNDQPCPPRYHVGEWGQCVGTCGSGTRTRTVLCKILLDFSKMYSIVPDDECPGIKPESTESCFLPPCSTSADDDEDAKYLPGNYAALIASSSSTTVSTPTSTVNSVNYYWQDSGYTECSASCLGGTQENIIQCIRDNDTMIVSQYLCNIEEKPESITKTCNDHPCPPRWTTTDFGPCSKPCGAGVQIREVKCIHEVTRGFENALHVPHDRCIEPKPIEERVCNEDPCPTSSPIDKVSQGNKCKGENCLIEGKKKRKCSKDRSSLSNSHPSKCNKKKKKSKHTDCKSGKCKSKHGGGTESDNNTIDPYGQPFIQTQNEKKVSLRIGGTAIIHEGTILKIRCPRRKMENDLLPDIEWTKNDFAINYDDKISLTRLGALKIHDVDFTDSGTYTCAYGNTKLSMTVQVVAFKPTTSTTTTQATYLDNGESINYAIETKEPPSIPDDYSGQLKTGPSPPYELDSRKRGSSLNELSSYFKKNKLDDPNKLDNQEKPTWYQLRKIGQEINNNNRNWDLMKSKDIENRPIYYADQQSSQLFHNVADDDSRYLKSGQSTKGTVDEAKESRILNKVKLSDKSALPSNPISDSVDQYISGKLIKREFVWLVSPWSSCSVACGGEGFEVRAIKCIEKHSNVSIDQDEASCINSGLGKPETNRTCHIECPKWTTGPWGECSKCLSFGQGKQTRDVNCTLSGGKILPPTSCDMNKYPAAAQTCSNVDCRPMWYSSKWSPCSGVCGKEGTQDRTVDCVWLADRLMKTVNCDQANKPITVRKCHVHCDKDKNFDCVNASFLCKYAVSQSCGHPVFRSSCCKSCRDSDFITIKS
ncbi:LOW QUALITY PROTEIN: ADAMTS-like protein 1 [Panonychus citri]|uniref:LOW QUALITY PROTEIN: ADAMTS-like protein 1 n=1 Tax=Panonychus citri TaxID=50023 RepID=UPI0023070528|nr:LOW QUALITY PROTEIN: ADAMTS-like protein 1 [Panonychus citri]